MELDALPQPELERLEQLGNADLVIGILDSEHTAEAGAAIAAVRQALAQLSRVTRAVVVCNNGTQGSADSADSGDDRSLAVFSYSQSPAGPAGTRHQSMSSAYQHVFAVGGKLGVRAGGVIASDLRTLTPQWIHRLLQPVIDLAFDLVAPRYTRHKMEGLLNRSILSPLHRALYGVQLQNPMGPDFGLSGKLLQRILGQVAPRRRGGQVDLLGSIASTAAADGFQICESHLGARSQPPTDWQNLSSLLAEVLGPVFLEIERQVAFWQGIRGSKPVPQFGAPEAVSDDGGTVDVQPMIESFQLGTRDLQDVWGLILPPTTLLELRKLSRLAPAQFRMPDELWVRIVYDFALGHRLQAISRDHLLRSITPLYLGWIASFGLEVETAGSAEREARMERLCKEYEVNKSYLVSRWRWPDRFNP
ncbi:MAG TPA: hypothetical protein VIN93_15160 [Bryobacteraceae bacterium]